MVHEAYLTRIVNFAHKIIPMQFIILIAAIFYFKKEIMGILIISALLLGVYIIFSVANALSNKKKPRKKRIAKNNSLKFNGKYNTNDNLENSLYSMDSNVPIKGLIIKSPYIDRILAGTKTWEMRSRHTKQRGQIALIKQGSGQIVGLARLIHSKGPLSNQEKLETIDKHQISKERLESGETEKWKFAWVFEDAVKLTAPINYKHPNGAQQWVKLEPHTQNEIACFLKKMTQCES